MSYAGTAKTHADRFENTRFQHQATGHHRSHVLGPASASGHSHHRISRGERFPCYTVVLPPVASGEWSEVLDVALEWAVGPGVVRDSAADGAGFEVADILPPEGDVRFMTSGCVEGVGAVAPDGLARETHAGEALGDGEDDAAIGVIPGIGLVLAHDGELDAVDGEEFVQRKVEGLGGEDVDLDQGLAAGVVGTEGNVAVPDWRKVGEERSGQAPIGACPPVTFECVDVAVRQIFE